MFCVCVCVLVPQMCVCTYVCCAVCVCVFVSQVQRKMKTIEYEMCCNQKRRQDTSTDWGKLVYISPLFGQEIRIIISVPYMLLKLLVSITAHVV